MAIYLVDYENVYIEGLDGLESLTKSDEVVIFYTQNRCGLTFELHRRLITCQASVRLMEVTALSTRKNTVKNALDLQLSMYIGYLIGRRPQVPLYIISKDTDFDLDLTFFVQYLQNSNSTLEICSTIENALNGVASLQPSQILEAAEEETAEAPKERKTAAKKNTALTFPKKLKKHVAEILDTEDEKLIHRVCAILMAADNLLTLNNLLARYYHDGQQVKEIYHKLKPSFEALRDAAVSSEENAAS